MCQRIRYHRPSPGVPGGPHRPRMGQIQTPASFGSAARRVATTASWPQATHNAANATIHPMSFKRLAYCTVTSLKSATVMRRPWFPAAETHAIRANRPIQAVRPASPFRRNGTLGPR